MIDNRWNQGWDKKKFAKKVRKAEKIKDLEAKNALFYRAFKKLEDQMDGGNKSLKAKLVLAWFAAAAIIIGFINPMVLVLMAILALVVVVLCFPVFLVKPSMRGYFFGNRQ